MIRVERPGIANAEAETAEESEITPEMIAAGTLAFSEYDSRFEGPEENVVRIYRAMEIAKRR